MDDSKTNTLPDPELNPLLNPLLASHMGRWAEVYFTTPPERREQAVAELIQELRNDPSAEPVSLEQSSVSENDLEAPGNGDQTGLYPQSSFPSGLLRRCSVCGHQNSEEQNFCGMCGAPMQILGGSQTEPRKESPPAEAVSSGRASVETGSIKHGPRADVPSDPESSLAADSHEYRDEPASDSSFHDRNDNHQNNDRDNDRGRRSVAWSEIDLPGFALEPEPVPYRYRLYVGTALAILLTLLLYMAWRGTRAISGTSGTQAVASRALPPAPVDAAQPAPQQPAAKTEPSSTPQAAPERTLPARNQAERTPPQSPARASNRVPQVIAKAPATTPTAIEQSGAEDFATAERYLNGTQGGSRNSPAAATWLWRAVGKGNVSATMILSDLYLHGDGVSKSCDQARLLLDVAARKGSKVAGDRLRNLRAFGCE
jgi:hypothetical protein